MSLREGRKEYFILLDMELFFNAVLEHPAEIEKVLK